MKKNGMPEEIISKGKKNFHERIKKIDWKNIIILGHLMRVL